MARVRIDSGLGMPGAEKNMPAGRLEWAICSEKGHSRYRLSRLISGQKIATQ